MKEKKSGREKAISLFAKLNTELYNQGWTQEEIDLVLFGTTDDLRRAEFRGREGNEIEEWLKHKDEIQDKNVAEDLGYKPRNLSLLHE